MHWSEFVSEIHDSLKAHSSHIPLSQAFQTPKPILFYYPSIYLCICAVRCGSAQHTWNETSRFLLITKFIHVHLNKCIYKIHNIYFTQEDPWKMNEQIEGMEWVEHILYPTHITSHIYTSHSNSGEEIIYLEKGTHFWFAGASHITENIYWKLDFDLHSRKWFISVSLRLMGAT